MTADLVQRNKTLVWDFWSRLNDVPEDHLLSLLESMVHPAVDWNGPHPVNALDSPDALAARFWQPLRRAMPDLRRETYIFMGGQFNDKDWVCGTGDFVGTFARDWLGIPATGGPVHIRFGEFNAVRDGQITETYLLLDLIDLMRQAGIRVLPVSPGDESRVPGPHTGDGVLLTPQDEAVSRAGLQLVEAMIGGLGRFDGANLGSMSMAAYWSRQMEWYGPCGIGSARTLAEYEVVHAGPFLTAFPDRKGGHHKARFAEGNYIASTGWPSVHATHLGPWFGCPATGKRIGMRVMDWWRREGDLLLQNWVFIDIIDVFLQFGVDLMARLPERNVSF